MEPPPKRPRLQNADLTNENRSRIQASPNVRPPTLPSRFDGQGVQNTGDLNVGRDLQILNYEITQKTVEEREKEEKDKALKTIRKHRQAVLKCLRFSQMDVRFMSIKKAHGKTCQWFLNDPDYIQWLNRDGTHKHEHKSLLWIKGKPGAGKSTLMKLLLHETRQARPGDTIVSFFFNARGNDMEKSTVGLYQSLLVQLLEKDPSLHNILDNYPKQKNWSIELLKVLFEDVVKRSHKTLICFIDALDECHEQEIRDMILFLSELMDARDNFYTCFASRHYPNISVKNGCSAVLENKAEHDKDIAKYLKSALQIGGGELAEQILSEIKHKASGVFMWVVLVVSILNRECDKGHKHALRRRLRQIPGDLDTLFHEILTRDTENERGLLLCIQWVLFAAHPLSPRQLYYGILAGLEPENLADPDTVTDYITDDDISKFLLDMSKGLAESTRSESPTVQFIHESVRDFLLDGKGLEAIWPGIRTNLTGKSHEALKLACHAFMTCMPVSKMLLEPRFLYSIDGRLPFLGYANQWILYHANKAAKNKYAQTEFLNTFPLADWMTIRNLFNRTYPPRYSSSVTLSYVLASRNLDALISSYKTDCSCFHVRGEKYGIPLFAAIASGSLDACRAIMEREITTRVPSQNAMDLYLSNSPTETCLAFFQDHNFQLAEHRDIIFCLAKAGDSQLLRIFCATQSFDINALDRSGKTPLLYAVERGHFEVVKVLAEQGANLDLMSSPTTDTPLLIAIVERHRSMARLLIEKGANINAKDSFGRTPLYLSASGGLFEEAGLLFNKGAEVDAKDDVGRTPCSLASYEGHIHMVKLLIDKGADVSARDRSGWTPCFFASYMGHIEVVRLLLDHGADVNAVDEAGQSALNLAKSFGHNRVADLLVERGAVSWGR
ncbi:hypothetical protein PG985_014328 [Apiospora marii]|uniref:uncharacterized protein n=1 Tax=Apiospora marii TaxID=335849 RepID=UPI00312E50D5